jgi:hypothetical protein
LSAICAACRITPRARTTTVTLIDEDHRRCASTRAFSNVPVLRGEDPQYTTVQWEI